MDRLRRNVEKHENKHVLSSYSHAKMSLNSWEKWFFFRRIAYELQVISKDTVVIVRERNKFFLKFHCLYWYACDSSVQRQQISS